MIDFIDFMSINCFILVSIN